MTSQVSSSVFTSNNKKTKYLTAIAQSVKHLATGWTAGVRNPDIFRILPEQQQRRTCHGDKAAMAWR